MHPNAALGIPVQACRLLGDMAQVQPVLQGISVLLQRRCQRQDDPRLEEHLHRSMFCVTARAARREKPQRGFPDRRDGSGDGHGVSTDSTFVLANRWMKILAFGREHRTRRLLACPVVRELEFGIVR